MVSHFHQFVKGGQDSKAVFDLVETGKFQKNTVLKMIIAEFYRAFSFVEYSVHRAYGIVQIERRQ